MYNEPLIQQTINKLRKVTENYESLIFEKIGELDSPMYLITKNHLRKPPTEGLSKLTVPLDWGGYEKNLWITGTYTVKEPGKKLYAVSHAGGWEEMFFLNGKPYGIFSWKYTDCCGGVHDAAFICDSAEPGTVFELAFECYSGHFNKGIDRFSSAPAPVPDEKDSEVAAVCNGVDICVMNEEVNELVRDLYELISLTDILEDNNMMKYRARRALTDIAGTLKMCPQHYEKSVWLESVRESLKITRPLFSSQGSRIFGKVGLIGHSHMDSAWLWEYKETIRKCARTFSNAMALMDQFPAYKFIQSSVLHCEWMKKYYPDVFEEMKKKSAEGRYIIDGGAYVECDCNLTSGEFMIRQFLEGQWFTRENFGITAESFWLPDTFGYNANMPQLMKGCGLKYFFTQKLYGVEIDGVNFESFRWRGIDNSEVFCHYPCGGIIGNCRSVHNATAEIKHKDSGDMHLLAFGQGDGGGGPTRAGLEAIERAMRCEGLPESEYTTLSDFMEDLIEEYGSRMPVVDSELYYEYHRGTLTQMHDVKQMNRRAEFAVRDAEYFSVLSGKKLSDDFNEKLKNVLLNQFHDILPGTCIKPVYDTYRSEMTADIKCFEDNTYRAASSLTEPNSDTVTVFNTLPFERHDVVTMTDITGVKGYPSQQYTDITGKNKLDVGNIKVKGFSSVTVEKSNSPEKGVSPFTYDGATLQTPFAVVKFDDNGYISSFVDKKSGRELKKSGALPLGVFLIAEDCPQRWDNWNVEIDTINNLAPVYGFVSREVVTDGAVEIRLRSKFNITGKTTLIQDAVFYADSPRVDFQTVIDWHDKHLLLKTGFDLDIRAREARNEIQFGHVLRPTHKSTSYDLAKFEVCMHKWTDISESRFGAAILSDCKYGISQHECNLCLSLHRGGTEPDPTGDEGLHEMTYSFLPHDGDFCTQSVIMPAYELNVPHVLISGTAKDSSPFLSCDCDHVLCETVKPSRNDPNAYIVRFYECEGSAAEVNISLGRHCTNVCETNMIEDILDEISVRNDSFTFSAKPFEIKTFLIKEK